MGSRFLLEVEFKATPENLSECHRHLDLMRHSGVPTRRDYVFEAQDNDESLLWVTEWDSQHELKSFVDGSSFQASLAELSLRGLQVACRTVDLGHVSNASSPKELYPRHVRGRELNIGMQHPGTESSRGSRRSGHRP